jgi:Flp pilus assembly CpaE family ATPase
VFFNQSIRSDKGTFQALNNSSGNVSEKFWKSGIHDNLFLLSIPNEYKGLLADGISDEEVETMLNQACVFFDFLIVDGSEDINNPISSIALTMASSIFTLYKPSIASCLWQRAMEDFIMQLHLKDKLIHMLSANDSSCPVEDFLRSTGLHYSYELPFVKSAPILENTGTPICLINDKECKRYSRVLDTVADELCG